MKRQIYYKQIQDGPLGEFGSRRYELTVGYAHRTDVRTGKGRIEHGKLALYPAGGLCILPGYKWDGPSGPTMDDDQNMRASLVHDALYGMLRAGCLGEAGSKAWKRNRKIADKLYRAIMRKDGAPIWRAWYHYWGVRLFGRIPAGRYR